jgi:cell wall assembly regulator SMI1
MRSINASWDTIESELAAQFPKVLASLSPPAEELDVVQMEDALGCKLPSDFRASLMRHNGQDKQSLEAGAVLFCNAASLLGTVGILHAWTMWQEISADEGMEVHPSSDTSTAIT